VRRVWKSGNRKQRDSLIPTPRRRLQSMRKSRTEIEKCYLCPRSKVLPISRAGQKHSVPRYFRSGILQVPQMSVTAYDCCPCAEGEILLSPTMGSRIFWCERLLGRALTRFTGIFYGLERVRSMGRKLLIYKGIAEMPASLTMPADS